MADKKDAGTVILVIGGSGTIGSAVVTELKKHGGKVIVAGSKSGDVQIDFTKPDSIEAGFKKVGPVDHVVVTGGGSYFGPLSKMTPQDVSACFQSKVGGQMNVVLVAQKALRDKGSITLTSGYLDALTIPLGVGLSTANGAINSFVRAAATELERGIRINVVSPGLVTESLSTYGPYFKGLGTLPVAKVAPVYVRSIYGGITGKVLEIVAPEYSEK